MFPISDTKNNRVFPIWTIAIIAINVYVFFIELTSPNTDFLIFHYALVPAFINFAHPASLIPLVTAQFLHGGLLHIITNMWFLWIFGDNVEGRLGFFFFPLFYLAAGVAGNLLQYAFIPSSTIPILGASGAIAGVLGAYQALFPQNKVKTLVFILLFITIVEIPASFVLFYWFILQLFSSAVAISQASDQIGGVAYFAHIGGFAAGWILGKIILLISTNALINKTK